MAIRSQYSTNYLTLVKNTLVTALRNTFDSGYPEQQMQNLRVYPEFALTQATQYPAVYVRYNASRSYNAGVGHEEYFRDPNGDLRRWFHRRFEGTVDFIINTLSPFDRDIVADTIHELLAFGPLSPIQDAFFTYLYGDPNNPNAGLSILQQLALNTDILDYGGDSVTPNPWRAEDPLIYQSTVSVGLMGGIYNTIPNTPPLGYVTAVQIFPYITGATSLQIDPTNPWAPPMRNVDFDTVSISVTPSGTESQV